MSSETERLDGLESGLVNLIGVEAKTVRDSILRSLSVAKRCSPSQSSHQYLTSASTIIADEVARAVR